MRKTVLTFGLLSGALSGLMMAGTVPFMDRIGFDRGVILGYTAIVISFLFVYAGVKSYRDTVAGGQLSFRTGLVVGGLITLVSCVCYVIAWQVVYYNFIPDFLDKYSAYVLDKLRAEGTAPAAIDEKAREMAEFKVLYANPLVNAALTLLEPLPVGIVVTLVSAVLLRKKLTTETRA